MINDKKKGKMAGRQSERTEGLSIRVMGITTKKAPGSGKQRAKFCPPRGALLLATWQKGVLAADKTKMRALTHKMQQWLEY